MAGLVIGITVIFFQTSLATLIFSGQLSGFVGRGIGLILFGGTMLSLAITFFSSLPGVIPAVQDSPAAVFALVATALILQIPSETSPEKLFYTIVASISATAILTGVVFLLISHFGLSSFIRFVPYPVVGGFLAGTGWLLFKGALGVLSGINLQISTLPELFKSTMFIHWVPGILFALALFFTQRKLNHPLVMPVFMVAGVVLFYLILFVTKTSVSQAMDNGFLLGPLPTGSLWSIPNYSILPELDWRLILSQIGKMMSIIILSTIALLLNANALELATQKDVDLNRELYAAGIGNILSGLGGGPIGYQTIGSSVLSHRIGGGSRTTTLVVALLSGTVLFVGASMLSYFPKPILGGLLLFLSFSFLTEWVYDAARKLPRTDYILVLVILVIVGSIGFLEGVGAGTVIAVILFVVNYSRVEFVKDTLSGVTYRSNMERPKEHRQLLEEKAEQIFILRLQGFLFFGTAQNLLTRIRERINDKSKPALRFLILDFHRVAALDSSAVVSFTRMLQLVESNKIHLILTDVNPKIITRLEQGGLTPAKSEYYKTFPLLDYGMEWCESKLLSEDSRSMIMRAATLKAQLKKVFSTPEQIDRFMTYLEKQTYDKGHILINQGDTPNEMYFIDTGRVNAVLEVEHGKFIRLRSMSGGAVVGEVGLYLKQIRTANITTETPSIIYKLTEESLNKMAQADPDIAAILHFWMARLLAERLSDNNRTLEALLN
jgi:SulP family sulfate permease